MNGTQREWARMIEALTLRTVGGDRFEADSYFQPRRIFGGQLVGQAVVAAGATTAPDRSPSTAQCVFLRSGDPAGPVELAVRRIQEGRSFSVRRVDVTQDDVLLFTATVTFHRPEDGPEHQVGMPVVPEPEQVPSQLERMAGIDHPVARHWGRPRPVELRHVTGPVYLDVSAVRSAEQCVWLHCGGPVPDHPALAAAILGFISDYSILEPVLRRHGLTRRSAGLALSSLNHTIWWHRPPLLEPWLLYAQESPSAGAGRGLSVGRIHGRAGRLIATVAQEGLYRGTGGSGGR